MDKSKITDLVLRNDLEELYKLHDYINLETLEIRCFDFYKWNKENMLTFPDTLKTIKLVKCAAGPLPSLPAGLKNFSMIECSRFRKLPPLPNTLEYLDCNSNSIENIPDVLPETLKYFNCSWNSIWEIESLPSNLEYFSCHHNDLSKLPDLPDSLKYLNCDHNPPLKYKYKEPFDIENLKRQINEQKMKDAPFK